MAESTRGGITRRQVLQAGGATFAGYAVGVDKALAQAITTDTSGIAAGEFEVKIGDYGMPVYEARPAAGGPAPIVVCISEIWGVHEWVRDCTRRFAKAGYYAVAPELFKREGGVGHLPNVQDILKIVLAVPQEAGAGRRRGDGGLGEEAPGRARRPRGVTGWCWGGSTVYQVAATNPDIKAAVAWYGPPARPYPDTPTPVTGFDVAKDLKMPFLGLYGETDQNPKPEDVKKLEEMVKQVNKNAEFIIYPGVGHGFFADYRPSYNAAAAADAWKRCTGCLDKTLKA